MIPEIGHFTLWIALGVALVHLACGGSPSGPGGPTGPSGPGGPVPDFALVDVNLNSPSLDRTISPRDYLQQASAWYFGHST